MSKMLFVNLPVESLKRSVDFYSQLGFEFNPQFTSEDSTCMILSETNFVMLLEKPRFSEFVDKPIANTRLEVGALLSMNMDSADEVKAFCKKAFELGAREYQPARDLGFMYSQGFEDLDGHILEAFWMDPAAIEG